MCKDFKYECQNPIDLTIYFKDVFYMFKTAISQIVKLDF